MGVEWKGGGGGGVLGQFPEVGWTVIASFYHVCLLKDRSQYFMNGPAEEIRVARLWREFESLGQFRQLIREWVTTRYQSRIDILIQFKLTTYRWPRVRNTHTAWKAAAPLPPPGRATAAIY